VPLATYLTIGGILLSALHNETTSALVGLFSTVFLNAEWKL